MEGEVRAQGIVDTGGCGCGGGCGRVGGAGCVGGGGGDAEGLRLFVYMGLVDVGFLGESIEDGGEDESEGGLSWVIVPC